MNQLRYEKQFTIPPVGSASASCVVPQYKELAVTRPEIELGKREVEVEVNRRCIRYAEYLPVDDTAGTGDQVTIDFTDYVDGQPLEEGKIENFELLLGSNTLVAGFEDQIIGRAAGETFDITVTFPEEYPAEELRGKECTFAVTLHEVRHFTVPKASDEIARKEGYADLAEMTEAVRQIRIGLHRAKDNEKLEGELLERVIASAQSEISEPLMDFTVARLRKLLENQLASTKTSMESHLKRNKLTESELEEQLRSRAATAITKQLVVDGITEQENLEPTAQEIETAMEEYIKATPRVRQKSPQLKALMRERIACRKVGRFLLEHAVEG